MSPRPLLLDLFCGEGGAAVGYHRAGFDVIGVDIKRRPRYPFPMVQADALDFLTWARLGSVAAIHASPPCQFYSFATSEAARDRHPDLIGPVRDLLLASGKPWIIENVPGAPLRTDLKLCGCMFGLPQLRRERWFETSPALFDLRPSCQHGDDVISIFGHPGKKKNGSGRVYRATRAQWQAALGIDWMTDQGMALSIPPAYTEYIGGMVKAIL